MENDVNIEEYIKLAEAGDAKAQTLLGLLYKYGKFVDCDIKKAVYWFQKAANQNYAEGQTFLAVMYETGNGVEKDLNKAIALYKKSADQGFVNAQNRLGFMYEEGIGFNKDLNKALYWFQKAADQGYANAQYNLGVMYETGNGIEKDLNKAITLYRKAAKQGNANAQYNLGNLYYLGEGVIKDKEMALYWFQKAANKNCSNAQFAIGFIYYSEPINEQDYEKAIYWFQKAADNGHLGAQNNLGIMYDKGRGVEQDKEKAIYWYQKAAEQGDTKAQFNLGAMYELSDGIKADYEKALYWYKKAAENNYFKAQNKLGEMYQDGKGTEQDYEKALYWYKQSADNDNAEGQYLYAFLLIDQYYSTDNFDIAINLLKNSLNKGYYLSAYFLGFLYEDEYFDIKDYKLAYYYYKKADELGCDCSEDVDRLKDLLIGNILHLTTRKDIFISWNHNNKDVKDELVSFLEENGLCTVWESDGDGIGNINEIIESAIENSKAYILLLTGNSIESDWVKEEVGIIFSQLKDCSEIKNTIVPLILNYKMVDGKRIPFDTLKGISELEEDNPIHNVLNLTSQFAINGVEIDYNSLEKVIKSAIEYRLKIEYRSKIRDKFSTFNAALTKVVDSSNISSNIISSTLDFNNCYINRPVYDIDDNAISNSDVLKYPLSLIYGEGGTGKTLYLKNIVRNQFTDNNYIFYLPCKNIVDELEKNLDFIEILKKESFDFYFPNDYKISLEGFSNLFTTNNKIIILIDALDEISTLLKNKLYELLNKFINAYEGLTYLKIIFTSRNSIDAEDISSKLNTPIRLFNLRGLSDEDINTIFDNISANCNANNDDIFKITDKNEIIKPVSGGVSKDQFFISLEHISNDIKKNPLLLSNLIYVYIVTHRMPNKQFEIIQKSSELLTNTLDNDRDIRFKYGNYIRGNKLDNLLGYLTFKRSKNSNESVVDIFKNYLIKKNLIVNNDDPSVVAEEIYKYLSRRSIIIRDNVAHEIFRDYYTAVYIYNMLFTKDEDEDLCESYICFKENYEIKLNNMITKNLSNPELPWPSIATDLLTKLDFEIYNLDTKQVIDQDNLNYDVFNIFLTKTLKVKGYSEEAIKIIKGLASNELLYFTEFIKQYIN